MVEGCCSFFSNLLELFSLGLEIASALVLGVLAWAARLLVLGVWHLPWPSSRGRLWPVVSAAVAHAAIAVH